MSNTLPPYLQSIQSLLTAPSTNTSLVSAIKPSAIPAIRDPKKLQFLLVSTHCQQVTGYSKVSWGMVQQVGSLPWIQMTHFGFQKFHQTPPDYRTYPSNVEVLDVAAMEKQLPAPQQQQGFGFSLLPDIIRKKQPHVVMIYNDMSVVAKFLEEIRISGVPRNFKIWVYCDQVYDTQLQGYLDILNRDADCIFTFSPYWKKCLKDQGITRPIDVILHGFDSTQFFPVPREIVRKQMELPADAFIFLNLNRNQPRKRLDIMIMAFVELIVKYPTKPIFLMSITDRGEKGGWWLGEVFKNELKMRNVPIEIFGTRLLMSTRDMTFSDMDVNMFYNLADVGINTSDGEGWGLCNFEQMGVGIPQVVPDIGGFKEFCTKDNSVLVKPKQRYYLPTVYSPVGGEARACDPHDVCLAMEEYVDDSELRAQHGKNARETVLKYTWTRAMERLIKRLDDEKKEVFEE